GVIFNCAGKYIANNRKLAEGEEKLHLVIEAPSELDVQAAIKEIQRWVDHLRRELGLGLGLGGAMWCSILEC
ncbi:unnamed protein product, partial [Discosporangium mesarthrocarpum]